MSDSESTNSEDFGISNLCIGPYACTYLCGRAFNKVTDWRRHENSQHISLEQFFCPHCKKGCHSQEDFERHLLDAHELINYDLLDVVLGENCQKGFWCGFCRDRIELFERGIEAWNERFVHLARHFEGYEKSQWPRMTIEQWVVLEMVNLGGI